MNPIKVYFIFTILTLCLMSQLTNAKNMFERIQVKIETDRQRILFNKFEKKSNESVSSLDDKMKEIFLIAGNYKIPFKELPRKTPNYRTLDRKSHRLAYDIKHMTYKEILKLLVKWRDIEEEPYKNKLELLEIGRTLMKRPIIVAKITDNVEMPNKTKTSIFIETGIHAREWATVDTAMYIMSEMMFEPYYMQALKNYVFHFLIITNPDGYVYSWETNRWWRKNLRAFKKSSCLGVDLNRNFDLDFGASQSTICNEDYNGPKAFSEKESQAERDYLMELIDGNNKIDLFLAFHSYGQQLTYPYGYSQKRTSHWKESRQVLKKVSENLSKYNAIDYKYGQTYFVIYPASGGSDDWTAYQNISKLVFVIELRDKGGYGFFLPEEKIEENALDGLVALNTILNHLSPGIVKIKKPGK